MPPPSLDHSRAAAAGQRTRQITNTYVNSIHLVIIQLYKPKRREGTRFEERLRQDFIGFDPHAIIGVLMDTNEKSEPIH